MKISYSEYDYLKSIERINEILDSSDNDYLESKNIPTQDKLTYKNGYYVDITVVFIDMRKSKELSSKHTRPVLAKIYRAFISEVIAILKGTTTINEIYVEGDGVWGVFNTETVEHINEVFETAGRVLSLVDILNIQFLKKGYSQIKIGIGIDDGKSLYMQAGYKGSGINEVVWIGKVVGETAKLCNFGNKEIDDKSLMVSERIYSDLTDKYKSFMHWNTNRNCYHGNIHNIGMNEWVKKKR